jgi:autoinducer 2-degrading protein
MHILIVHIVVKPESVEAFKLASFDNARESGKEAGVVRFDVLQQTDEPTHLTLLEVYKTPADHLKHRETVHYQRWRDLVEPMMAEPRQALRYVSLFPGDESW